MKTKRKKQKTIAIAIKKVIYKIINKYLDYKTKKHQSIIVKIKKTKELLKKKLK